MTIGSGRVLASSAGGPRHEKNEWPRRTDKSRTL